MVEISSESFGAVCDENGQEEKVTRFTLTNCHSASVSIITYGATVMSIRVPDRHGIVDDVVLGFDGVEGYVACPAYIGATVGRVANRIDGGKFGLDGRSYQLTVNKPPHHLHGGIRGFDKVVWEACVEEDSLAMAYVSKAGEEGYPGEVNCRVNFRWSDENALLISYSATTTQPTPVSLTNHSYFNLSGHAHLESIDSHELMVNANFYTPKNNETSIPTGEIKGVDGTAFDLRVPLKLEKCFLAMGDGYDHNFCLDDQGLVASRLHHPGSGRTMDVTTTMPGLQVYTANFFPEDESLIGKQGVSYKKHGGICLETQHYPNAVNQANFPNSVLCPLDVYNHTTIYKFSN